MDKRLYGPMTLPDTLEDRMAAAFHRDPAHYIRQAGMWLVITVCVAANLI